LSCLACLHCGAGTGSKPEVASLTPRLRKPKVCSPTQISKFATKEQITSAECLFARTDDALVVSRPRGRCSKAPCEARGAFPYRSPQGRHRGIRAMIFDRTGKAATNERKYPLVVEVPVAANESSDCRLSQLAPHPAAIWTHHLAKRATLLSLVLFRFGDRSRLCRTVWRSILQNNKCRLNEQRVGIVSILNRERASAAE